MREEDKNITMDEAPISLRAKNALKRYIINLATKEKTRPNLTLERLLQIDYKVLKDIDRLGKVSLKEIEDWVHSLGYSLLNEKIFSLDSSNNWLDLERAKEQFLDNETQAHYEKLLMDCRVLLSERKKLKEMEKRLNQKINQKMEEITMLKKKQEDIPEANLVLRKVK